MAATQMNTRIDEDLKRRGDEVIAKHGLTPSQVVRAVWEHIDKTGDLPEFMREIEADEERKRKIALVESSSRIVADCLRQCGGSGRFVDGDLSYKELRDFMYDDMLVKEAAR